MHLFSISVCGGEDEEGDLHLFGPGGQGEAVVSPVK